MPLERLEDDLNIIQALDDEPNDVGGLNAAQLKAKFDEAGNRVKDYLNEKVVGVLNSANGADSINASDGKSVQANLERLGGDIQALAGGTVPGEGATLGWNLDAGGYRVVNLGSPAEQTDALNWGSVLPEALEQLLFGSVANRMPSAALEQLYRLIPHPWKLIEQFTKAGSGTFTVPDLFEGEDYELGVYLIGGGGSGAAAVRYPSDGSGAASGGGASGFGLNFVRTVSPGMTLNWTVGAGGAAVTASSNSNAGKDGNEGGSTTFDGKTARGGGGGRYDALSGVTGTPPTAVVGNSGGQASDDILSGYYLPVRYGGTPPVDLTRPVAGKTTTTVSGQEGTVPVYTFPGTQGKVFQPGRAGQNLFDPTMVALCCGGYALSASYTSSYTILPPDTN